MHWIHDEDRTECYDEDGRMLASVHPIRTTAPGPTGWELVIFRPKPKPAPDTGARYFIEHYRTRALAMAAARVAVQVYY